MSLIEKFDEKTVFSLEVFPPRKESSLSTILDTLNQLNQVKPDFISVTLGAGGSARNNETVKVADLIQNKLKVPAIAHVPGLYQTKEQIDTLLNELRKVGVTNILALRGDLIPGKPAPNEFLHANDLVSYIKKTAPDFEISGACYPEHHPESVNFVDDIHNLKNKVNSGCNHLISQLFFDNQEFFDFQEKLSIADITVPVEAGIMPCTSKKQIERIAEVSGIEVPRKFRQILDRYSNNKLALKDAGIAYAVDQIIDLVAQGVDGIHLYTMNHPDVANRIWEATKNIFKSTQNSQLIKS